MTYAAPDGGETTGYVEAARTASWRTSATPTCCARTACSRWSRRSISRSALAIDMIGAALSPATRWCFKPARSDALDRRHARRITRDAGLPDGRLQLVQGGPERGAARDAHRRHRLHRLVRGRHGIARTLADGPLPRPVVAEMGGKNPAIVPPPPTSTRRPKAWRARPSAAGPEVQRLLAGLRRARDDEFVDGSSPAPPALAIGDPSERDVCVGPVINAGGGALRDRGRERPQATAASRRGGARRRSSPGHFVEPTVVCGLPQRPRAHREELFLPFVTVGRVDSLAEALAEANAPCTGSPPGSSPRTSAEIERFLDGIEAGVVYVNRRAARPPAPGRDSELRRLEGERLDRQGRARPVLPAEVHARAEPDDRGLSSATSASNTSG